MGRNGSIDAEEFRTELMEHMETIGLDKLQNGSASPEERKQLIRNVHVGQRRERAERERAFFEAHAQDLLQNFASGEEVSPKGVDPALTVVQSGTREAHLFRLATLLWSVPVSRGFGRRMRFVVRDRNNGKLIGLFALGSPVFNLNARDEWIGWNAEDRRQRLIHVMDAYVLGAVPPYNQLLGAKLVGALIGSKEVEQAFARKYAERESVATDRTTSARLALVTATSALGRSSIYNRLRLKGLFEYERIGWTQGWGHFHVPDYLFERMRELLEERGHSYASGHSFEDGPSWRLRVIRVALEVLGIDPEILHHGIQREVFGVPLAGNWRAFLLGEADEVQLERPSLRCVATKAVERWVAPRAKRRPNFQEWRREDTWRRLAEQMARSSPEKNRREETGSGESNRKSPPG